MTLRASLANVNWIDCRGGVGGRQNEMLSVAGGADGSLRNPPGHGAAMETGAKLCGDFAMANAAGIGNGLVKWG